MAEPFLFEIRIFSFGFAPKGWALCNGQLLPINQNQALFSLLGTTFGGDGRVNFALPNLQSRTPIHVGSGHTLGQRGGEQAHTLSIAEIPTHLHIVNGNSANATAFDPLNNLLAKGATANTNPLNVYGAAQQLTALLVLRFINNLNKLVTSYIVGSSCMLEESHGYWTTKSTAGACR